MKKIIGLCLLLLGASAGHAQQLRLSLRGEQLSRPGLQAVLELPQQASDGAFTTHWGPRISTYYHPTNHLAVMPGLEQGLTYNHSSGFFAGVSLHFSLYRSFYKGQTYRPQADGSFKKVPLGGQWGWAPGIDLRLGYAVSNRLHLITGASYYQQRPYNHSFRHGWAVEAGIRTSLKP